MLARCISRLLKPDGTGKAEAKPDKLIIGSPLGMPIVLAPPNDLLGMAVTQGVEGGPERASNDGARRLVLPVGAHVCRSSPSTSPSYIEAVTIFAHADKAGHPPVLVILRARCNTTIRALIFAWKVCRHSVPCATWLAALWSTKRLIRFSPV